MLSRFLFRLAVPALSQSANISNAAFGCRRLENKVAVLTGSTDGIGLETARRMAQEGAAVMISSRKQPNVDRALEDLRSEGGLKVSGMVCHSADKEHRRKLIDQTIKEFGGIDIVVANAAVNPHVGPMMDVDEEKWDKIFDVNLKAVFFLCKEVHPIMQKRGGGSIVLISSAAAYRPPEQWNIGPYCVSKAAHFSLVKAMAPHLGESNIRVNCIAAGLFKTNFGSVLWKEEGMREQVLAGFPLHRLGDPKECATVAAFLASDDASHINAETITVAGTSFRF